MNPPSAPRVMLQCIGVTKQYAPSGAGARDVSLEVTEGQILALVGPSGCGKTTLLRMIAGLEGADAGTIEIDGRQVTAHDIVMQPERRNVGFVFQDYALFPHMTIASNIAYGLPRNTPNRERRVEEMLELVNLSDRRNRRPHELSGGERQRIALARALAPAPKILLMDEPFSNLDPNLSARLQQEVRALLHEARMTVIFVTHDQEAALSMGDVIAVMNEGRIQQIGAPDAVFHSPVNRFVAGFLGEADFIPAEQPITPGSRVRTELGETDVSGNLVPSGSGPLDLMLRPEDISICADDKGNGHVVARIFSGPFYTYTIELDSGRMCRALASHANAIAVGARVTIRIDAGHPLPIFPRMTREEPHEDAGAFH